MALSKVARWWIALSISFHRFSGILAYWPGREEYRPVTPKRRLCANERIEGSARRAPIRGKPKNPARGFRLEEGGWSAASTADTDVWARLRGRRLRHVSEIQGPAIDARAQVEESIQTAGEPYVYGQGHFETSAEKEEAARPRFQSVMPVEKTER